MKYIFDAAAIARDVVLKRQVENRLTTRQAAIQAGVTCATISRIETRKGMSIETFLKICYWLNKEPCQYFKTQTQ